MRPLFQAGLAVCMSLMCGCAALDVSIRKGQLDVQTKMATTIFLEAGKEKTAFVDFRNTSDKPIDIKAGLTDLLVAKGYTIKQDPADAYYVLYANVLQVSTAKPSALESSLYAGWGGGAATGAAVGMIAGGAGRHGARLGFLGAVIGGMVDFFSGIFVKDVTYSLITDVKIAEKQAGATPPARKDHLTRILSSANKVNLKFEEAKPVLEAGLAKSITGLFPGTP